MSVTCDMLVVFSGYSGFLNQYYKTGIQYYSKSEDNSKMAANFKWTTPLISNLCNNINKNKFTYLVLCYTSPSFNYLVQTLGIWSIKVLNIIWTVGISIHMLRIAVFNNWREVMLWTCFCTSCFILWHTFSII